MNKKEDLMDGVYFLVLVLVVLAVFSGIIYSLVYATASGNEEITVKDKWTKHKGSTAKYLISSMDGQIFEISDSWLYWRFDDSNMYANIESGMTCEIQTQGFRFGFMSDYKNIIMTNNCRLK